MIKPKKKKKRTKKKTEFRSEESDKTGFWLHPRFL